MYIYIYIYIYIKQKTLYYIENSFLLRCLKKWILAGYSLLGSFLPYQKVIERRLMFDERIGAKLRSAMYPQIM